MKVRLLAPAAAEYREAFAWYDAQAPGLADRFQDEVQRARARIVERPHAWHPLGSEIRRYRLNHFPYGIIYTVEQDEIIILAIAHLHREPDYWRRRLGSTR